MSIHSLGPRPHLRFDSVIIDKGERLGHSLSCGLGKASKGIGGGSRAEQIPMY